MLKYANHVHHVVKNHASMIASYVLIVLTSWKQHANHVSMFLLKTVHVKTKTFLQKYEAAQLFSTLIIIRNVSWAENHHIIIIYVGSCDTAEVMMLEIQLWSHESIAF